MHEQAVTVVLDIVLLDQLSKLIGFLGVIHLMDSLHLVTRPIVVSEYPTKWGNYSLGLVLVRFHLGSDPEVVCSTAPLLCR